MTLKVFVADDSVTIQRIISLAFTGEDVAIEAVSDGDAAIEALQQFKPDIVFADVFMPGCTGYEVCAAVKDNPELKHTPVVLLVGTFEPFDEMEASRVKSDGRLTKPFDTSELIQTVHHLVGDRFSPGTQSKQGSETTGFCFSPVRGMVSQAAMKSFLGDNAILELFGPEVSQVAAAVMAPSPSAKPVETLSEDAIDRIVDRVVRKMSAEVIREVAWEVVPELSESIIRSTLKE